MAALTPKEFDLAIAQNTIGGVLDKAKNAVSRMSTPPQTIARNIYQDEQQPPPAANNQDAVVALTGTPKIPAANAAQPALQQSSGQSRETPIPVGKYGWKGTSESVNGNPTLVLGTPGTDNSGVGSWQPGSARPNNAVAALASSQRMAPQTVATGNSQPEPTRSPLEISHENWKNMSINQEAKPMSPAESALSMIDNAPLPSGLTASQKQQIMADRAAKKADIIAQLGGNLEVQKARNQGAIDEQTLRGANTMAIAKLESTDRATGHAIDLQRLSGENAVNKARIGTETVNQQKGQMEVGALASAQLARDEYLKNPTPENELKYRGALGKFEKEAQYGTVGKYDDNGMKVGENLYNKATGELRTDKGGQPSAEIPTDTAKRKVGQVYLLPSGYNATWDGKGWKPVQ